MKREREMKWVLNNWCFNKITSTEKKKILYYIIIYLFSKLYYLTIAKKHFLKKIKVPIFCLFNLISG